MAGIAFAKAKGYGQDIYFIFTRENAKILEFDGGNYTEI
jgi:hypothetical protein